MDWYIKCLTEKYASFDGRASRSEYWFFVLFNYVAYFALTIVCGILIGITGLDLLGVLPVLYLFGTFIPNLAVGARRLHDTDRSGWMQLLYIIPIVGFILWIVFCVQDSTFGRNNYGPNPKRPATV
ncbi:MAG: DUF805 domain-containing protein [Cyanobacteria bacterium J06649_4]